MSRWVLVALAAFAGMLVWMMATWPVGPESFEESAGADAPAQLPVGPVAAAPSAPPPPIAAAVDPPSTAEPQAQAEEPKPAIEEPPASAEAQADQLFIRENGPLAEYKAQFENEPRDSAANDAEVMVRGAFNPKDGPQPVFRSVLCRETICKIETRISTESMGAYVAGMTRIVHSQFNAKLATERTTLVEAGEVSVVVYAKRPHAEH